MLTHSRMACFRACPRRHEIAYELGIRPESTGFALRVGSAFHAALDAASKGLDVSAAMDACTVDPFDIAMVAAMYNAHCERYSPFDYIAREITFQPPFASGVIDGIARLDDGRLALVENKTTSRDFTPGADYWLYLHLDQQLSIYVIAARELGYDVATILYDVTRRPAQRPLKATPMELRQYTLKETRLKDGTIKPAGTLYANQRAEDETPEEFAARIAKDITERPDHYFARIEIARLDQDLDDCRKEIAQQGAAIERARQDGAWYRNPGACFSPYPCSYLAICQMRDLASNTPSGFVRSADVNPELSAHATPGASPAELDALNG